MSARLMFAVGGTAIAVMGAAGAAPGTVRQREGRVAFTVERNKLASIAIRSLVGGPLRLVRLPRFRGKPVDVQSIAWSPRADRFAFSDSVGRIFVAAASGSGLRLVASPAGLGRRYVAVYGWSPNGRTLAVATSVHGCTAGEPRLLAVGVDRAGSQLFPAHPPGSPASSASNPAYIGPVAWSPDGSKLAYGWQQFRNGDCRNLGGANRPTRVMTIGADGRGRREVAQLDLVFDMAWSPSGQTISLARACAYGDPFGWRLGGQEVAIATDSDFCKVSILDGAGQARQEAELFPSNVGQGAVLYAVDARSGRERVLRAFGAATSFQALGTMPTGAGIIALVVTDVLTNRLTIVPFDGSRLVPLPPLRAPRGMTAGTPAAVGFLP